MGGRSTAVLVVALVALLLWPAERAIAAPDDPLAVQQWHLERIGAGAASAQDGADGLLVAVLDTGVDADHPDLAGQVVDGLDLVDRGTPPDDENGHGTLVAGLIAAVAGNGVGVVGAAPGARILPVRVLDAEGSGNAGDVADGIRWAAEHGADVVNLSLADAPGDKPDLAQLISPEVEDAIRDADRQGVIVVAAAGNRGLESTPYDLDVPMLVVAASDRYDEPWPSANRDERTLFAPGVDMVSTHTGSTGYARADGTSFAAPLVAAGAVLLRARGLPADAVRARLLETARPIGAGAGLVDLAAALEPQTLVEVEIAPPPPLPDPTPILATEVRRAFSTTPSRADRASPQDGVALRGPVAVAERPREPDVASWLLPAAITFLLLPGALIAVLRRRGRDVEPADPATS